MTKPVQTSNETTPLAWKVAGGLVTLVIAYLVITTLIGVIATLLKLAVVAAVLIGAVALLVRSGSSR